MEVQPFEVRDPDQLLRWLADSYEQSQRLRIEAGERIRAVVQGRDQGGQAMDDVEAEEVLEAIRTGNTLGPVPVLGRTYRRFWQEEKELLRDMETALVHHPVYPWLSRVKGIGPSLGSKILARFDARKAPYASSFWSYAGLATVPGEKYECPECGIVRAFPAGYNISGDHKALGTGRNCKGDLVRIAGPEEGVRAAMPKNWTRKKTDPETGETKKYRAYDAFAKKTMYLAALQWVRGGGKYGDFYRREKEKIKEAHPNWAPGRQDHKARRKTEKLFLSHLWQVWREALDLPAPDPWAQAHGGHAPEGKIGPWEMVEDPK